MLRSKVRDLIGDGDDSVEWDTLRKDILERDDYTCQRCFHRSGPHKDDEGRVLQAHHVRKKSEGGSDDPDNLITLCRPCHGVQHPDNSSFDSDRRRASTFPNPSSDDRVAFVNSVSESVRLDEFIQNISGSCFRCGVNDEDLSYYTYPDFDPSNVGERPAYPAENIGLVCERCFQVVVRSDEDIQKWESNPINELYSIEAETFISPSDGVDDDITQIPQASVTSTGKFAVWTPESSDDWRLYYLKRVLNLAYNHPFGTGIIMLGILVVIMGNI